MGNEFERDSDPAWEERFRAMVAKMPREREPGRMLEERTVASLRRRGLLRQTGKTRLRTAWLTGGIAASIALFATGVVVGQWIGSRTTTTVMLALTRNNAQQAAAQVQRAGTQYVNSLQALASFAESNNTLPSQGREVALSALYAAANEVVRFAPNDPIAAEILRGFQRVRQQQAVQLDREPARQIIWF